MAELKQCEFFLLRYVPDAVKDEFVNIGVVLMGPGANESRYADLRFTKDWARVRCVDPAADIEMLEAMEAEIRGQLASSGEGKRESILKKLDDSFSNLVQVSGTKACLTESPQAEIESLAKLYLESSRREKRGRDAGARTRIAGRMKAAFEEAGVWDLMWKKVSVAKYTETGDPLKIDCGYKPNGVVRLFHALSLATDVDSAKVLAYSYPRLQEGILRKENAKAELTAILEDKLDKSDEQIGFAMEILEKSLIKTASVAEMAKIAETARREMRV
ncbi:MAG: hypothetical protein JWN45_364 [Acidobacteriaceae bacterium]|nr:hypothetical protein [Acidobacteriaceae bacterium]